MRRFANKKAHGLNAFLVLHKNFQSKRIRRDSFIQYFKNEKKILKKRFAFPFRIFIRQENPIES